MNEKRKVEIFSAGCPVCEEAVSVVKRMACSSCEVTVGGEFLFLKLKLVSEDK